MNFFVLFWDNDFKGDFMEKKIYNLTAPQKSILLTEAYFKGSPVNNICGTAIIDEILDFDLLEKAVNLFVKNNSSFRIRLILENNEVKQYISDFEEFNVPTVNVANKDDISKIENDLMSQVFDIFSNLFTFRLFRFPDGKGGFLVNVHHIISDSWTLGLLAKEIVRTYSHLTKNEELDFSNIYSYTDFIESEQDYISSPKFIKDKEYWNSIFKTIPEQASIIGNTTSLQDSFSCKANRSVFSIDTFLMDKINNFCKSNHISVFNFFMAVYSIYIGRVSNLDDFVIGTPILNRTNFKEKNTTGMFINTAPIRICFTDDMSFKSFAEKISKDSLGMLRHQKYSYQYILDDLRKDNPNLPNLYNTLISYQVTKANNENSMPYETRWAFNGNCNDDLDIHLFDLNDTGSLDIAYDYRTNRYTDYDINCVHNRILYIINQIIQNADISLNNIEIVTEEEKNNILYKFNNTDADYPKDKTVIDLFEEQVEKTPNNIAVVCGNKSLTYKQLNEKANILANYLVNTGVKPHNVIALRMPKCLEMIIGILGIMKAGACYLPINLSYPKERVDFMIKDSNALYFLYCPCKDEIEVSIPKINISLDNTDFYSLPCENLPKLNTPEDVIYIIYTSGSTGTPKGAMIMHKNVVRLLKNDKFLFDFNENDVWTMFHSVAFDFSVWEMYGALLYGGRLVLVPEDIAQDPNRFLNLLRSEKVTVLNQTPTYFYNLLQAELKMQTNNLNIRYIIYGGEALKPSSIKPWKDKYPFTKLINMYGITETTVHVTFKELFEDDLSSSTSNIGVPIPTLKVLILDKNLRLLPYGIEGEICVVGDGVFKGYLNRPDLSHAKLVPNPYNQEQIMYRSGDSAILHEDGFLEYCGRIDSQIKIRGFRIELGEIEEKMLSIKGISSCVVAKKTDEFNHDILCAYYVKNAPVYIDNVKAILRKDLPPYMVPQYFIELDALPYNHNGKINKNALPLPSTQTRSIKIIPPRNNIDEVLINILRDILHTDIISIEDSFIELGGDSLCAINFSTILADKLHVEVSVKDILKKTIIKDLSDYIATLPNIAISNNIILPCTHMNSYPLSSAQKRMYYTCKMIGTSNVVYNITGAMLIDGKLDAKKTLSIFKTILNRHEPFRTSFKMYDGEIRQVVKETVDFDIPVLTGNSKDIDYIISSFQKPFDLASDVLLRVSICYLENGKTLLLIDSHHIVLDGLSLHILIDEFCTLYADKNLADLKISYKDFSVWENSLINSEKIKPYEEYWIDKFKNSELPTLNLPYDYTNTTNISYMGDTVKYTMTNEFWDSYINFAKRLNVSPYVLFMSIFLVLLYKYTSQDELIIGSPTLGREEQALQNMVGMFVNNIVIDAKMKENQVFHNFVNYIKQQVLDDLKNQIYPYDMLVKKLSNVKNSSSNSLFDVAFVYQGIKNDNFLINGSKLELIDLPSKTAKFNLSLTIDSNFKTINLEYNTSLFKKETANSFLEHYIYTLETLLNNENITIKDIDIITPSEYELLDSFNNTYDEINNDTFISLFEKQVLEHPNDIALICKKKSLTYYELNKKANSLAHYLIKKGIGRNDVVCIMTNRSLETIVCMLGILKAGAAFFNVDPTYPTQRTQYYLEDSKTKYVLTQRRLKDKVKNIENCIEINLDIDEIYNYNFENPNVLVDKNDLSYIIYTSGSTGTPKGVMLNQVGLANMVKAMTKVLDYLKEGNKHTIVSVTSTPFDIFVYEIVVSLAHGLKVIMATNAEHRNPKLLDGLIRKHNVDVMTVTPSLMKINYDNREPDTALALVKNMVFGGEPLPEKFVKDLRALADDITIYNIYGPSEITVLSNVQNLDNEKEITVGPPIMNTQIHILDKNMRPLPIGVVGEIYISGIQVGLGYIGKPEMTAQKFMDNPFGEGKIYKSGDIGRWTFDGKVQCLGRVDQQIKLRGLRIELGEIENVMVNIPGVKASVVNKIEIEGKEVLCGYYVADSSVTKTLVKDTLRNALPYYMVPTYIIRLDEMPYTINRKIDRKALPLPELHKTISNNKININELDSNEEKLLQIWKNILSHDDIDVNDNFFDIGGDSISAINMQIEAVKYGLNFEYADIFNYPTIKQLSNKLPSPESNFMQNYDYSKINALLQKNVVENISTIKPFEVTDILLIGSTGYLGAHVLDEFLTNCKGTAYCLIRSMNNTSIEERLRRILNFYFGNKYDDEFGRRIKVIEGDIVKDNIGLSDEFGDMLSSKINAVINCAALVKHFGKKKLFEDVNVLGTKNIVDFCLKFSKRLLHVSTISISGNGEKEEAVEETLDNINDKKIFKETDLYIGQNIKGIYTTTKYKAEIIVLEAILQGLDAQILRVGNITNRYKDGVFQINVENNAFAKRVQAFIEIGAMPNYLLEHALELTPVDLCANCVLHLLQHKSDCNVFHLYNHLLLDIQVLFDTLNELGYEILPVSNKMMAYIISGILQDNSAKDILSGIIHDLDDNKKLIYTSRIRLNNDFSAKFLSCIGFDWQPIDKEYIKKYLNYFKDIGFIK